MLRALTSKSSHSPLVIFAGFFLFPSNTLPVTLDVLMNLIFLDSIIKIYFTIKFLHLEFGICHLHYYSLHIDFPLIFFLIMWTWNYGINIFSPRISNPMMFTILSLQKIAIIHQNKNIYLYISNLKMTPPTHKQTHTHNQFFLCLWPPWINLAFIYVHNKYVWNLNLPCIGSTTFWKWWWLLFFNGSCDSTSCVNYGSSSLMASEN